MRAQLLPNGNMLVPMRVDEDGMIGDGMIEVSSGNALYQEWLPYILPTVTKDIHTTAIVAFDMSGSDIGVSQTKFLMDQGDCTEETQRHITLVFLGETANLDKESITAKLSDFASKHAPIEGIFNGIAQFASEQSGTPVVMLFDSPELPAFRQALIKTLGYPQQNHGFTAHMTLVYSDKTDSYVDFPASEDNHMIFDNIVVMWGDEVLTYPLSGSVVEKQFTGHIIKHKSHKSHTATPL